VIGLEKVAAAAERVAALHPGFAVLSVAKLETSAAWRITWRDDARSISAVGDVYAVRAARDTVEQLAATLDREFGINVDSLSGRTFGFYGAANNSFRLDGTVFEVVEDANDGYRSAMERLAIIGPVSGLFSVPIAKVRVDVDENTSSECWKLVDADDGHVWLRFGTDNYDDYYPCFVFDYEPKTPKEESNHMSESDPRGVVSVGFAPDNDNASPRVEVVRGDVAELAGAWLDNAKAKAEQREREPLPVRQDGRDELWAMVEQLPSGTWKAVTITPLPLNLPALEVTGAARAALEPNLRHQYALLLTQAKIANRQAANFRAAEAEVRFA